MIRRVLFATIWFVSFALAILVTGGGIAGAMADRQASAPEEGFRAGYRQGYAAGAAAGAQFRADYGWVALTVAGLLAAGGSAAGILPGTKR